MYVTRQLNFENLPFYASLLKNTTQQRCIEESVYLDNYAVDIKWVSSGKLTATAVVLILKGYSYPYLSLAVVLEQRLLRLRYLF